MAKPFTTDELRRAYLDFFTAKGCTPYPSASLVPENDPTILFTVAGMAQFKDMFLGRGTHPFSKAVTCQKCIRTNDILNVGRTPRHHTFFEMLGNFSFNDYFKRETIAWAWEFLTQVVGLDPKRLSVSVHHIDDEAYAIWRDQIGIPESRIFRLGDKDNFWPANAPLEGPTGPGGCCSEIFWDFQTNNDPNDNLAGDTGRFVEVWNCVFPQFNVAEPIVDGRYTLEPLGRTNIDTGMGLERLACVVQGKLNNFDTDVLSRLVAAAAQVCERNYVEGAPAKSEQGEVNALLRRIADHVRAVTFCIADGALPGATGRGYVVRRLIRRATLDADKLGVSEARLYQVVQAVVAGMGAAYPEIAKRRELAEQTLLAEEQLFRRTLRRGLDQLHKALERQRGQPQFSGDDAFELFTTHGFPLELIEELVAAEGMRLDRARYDERWQAFVAVSSSKGVEVFTSTALQEAKPRLGATPFIGYQQLTAKTTITLLEHDGRAVASAPTGAAVRLALSQTPFYGESGGQVGDRGYLRGPDFVIRIDDVQKDEGLFIHSGVVERGTARPMTVEAEVDAQRRARITAHHSATHLLQAGLNVVLGDHVEQQGSKVEAEGLRFDYNNPGAPSAEQLRQVEQWVQSNIAAALPVAIREMPIAEAKAQGAKALFGEKYGSHVRVVRMGSEQPASVELCGGCHVANTADIGAFRIVRDEASSAGIRRIQAVAGAAAQALAAEETAQVAKLAALMGVTQFDGSELPALQQVFKATGPELLTRVQALADQVRAAAKLLSEAAPAPLAGVLATVQAWQQALKQLQRRGEDLAARMALDVVKQLRPTVVEGLPLLSTLVPGADGKALRQAAEHLATLHPSHLIVLGGDGEGKANLVVAVSGDGLARGLKAGELCGVLAKQVGGGGGGKPQFAQAGGKDPAALPQALAGVPALVAQRLSAAART